MLPLLAKLGVLNPHLYQCLQTKVWPSSQLISKLTLGKLKKHLSNSSFFFLCLHIIISMFDLYLTFSISELKLHCWTRQLAKALLSRGLLLLLVRLQLLQLTRKRWKKILPKPPAPGMKNKTFLHHLPPRTRPTLRPGLVHGVGSIAKQNNIIRNLMPSVVK